MADATKTGTDWGPDELDAIVVDYFAMLALDAAAQPFVKAHRARALMERTGRSHRSVEFKHMNISAVAAELGLPTVRGYRPLANYQAAIFDAIDRHLTTHPEVLRDDHLLPVAQRWGGGASPLGDVTEGATRSVRGVSEPAATFDSAGRIRTLTLTEAPPPGPPRTPRPEGLARLVRKYDPAARDHANRTLGRLGEEQVFHHERARLIAADRPDLARRIEWTSQERGDGAGYDIRSFDPTGSERLIEVKATRGGPTTPFWLTRTEREVSMERPDNWRLYRLHDLSAAPGLFVLPPPLEASVTLEAENWRAAF
ncbi:hypothetical protein KOAAANKH_00068 [Brevundimonas sp. NIBR10]|uniref:DUF3883 domain-containing protein n=1 Tax=Brevundimonas sp. NIBR10 TaxID=3015997 RepID=UPI0022F1A6A2|nr:DUF3883 domain-containing protein [Brevundimonas sp. NIBR10]WGM45208.1 hypothetical protein KOAAANKH_00068 [Brevundimonas sp. NIBR10]